MEPIKMAATPDRRMDFWRQLDIFDPNKNKDLQVTIIGAGGIGSPTVVALAKMGVKSITIYDDDKVELHNLSSQFFGHSSIGEYKVDSIAKVVKDFSGLTIKTHTRRFTKGDAAQVSGILIGAVDSLEIRREIWEGLQYNIQVPLYLCGRMGAEVMRIITCCPWEPNHVRHYGESIDPATPVKEAPCTNKAIIYNTFAIASMICNQVKLFQTNFDGDVSKMVNEIIFDFKTISLIKRSWK